MIQNIVKVKIMAPNISNSIKFNFSTTIFFVFRFFLCAVFMLVSDAMELRGDASAVFISLGSLGD